MKTALSFLSALILLLSGCSGGPTPEKAQERITLNLGSEPHSLDPRKGRDLGSQMVIRHLFDGLTRIGQDGKPELALAEKVQISEDGTRYTFTLKSSNWSNGERVTASDFAYGWKKILDPKFPTDLSFYLYGIRNAKAAKEGTLPLDQVGVRAVDAVTLEVELDKPLPYFLELVAFPAFFPIPEKVEMKNPDWATRQEGFVGNGPFVLKAWKVQDNLLLEKNPRYWDASHVKVGSIQLLMVSQEIEMKMFERGELHWAGSPLSLLPTDGLQQMREQGIVKSRAVLGSYFLRVNVTDSTMSNHNLRKALTLSINREALVKHVIQSGTSASGLVPPQMGLQEQHSFRAVDLEAARHYFAEALDELDMTAETLPQITFLYANSNRNHLMAQAIQSDWEKAFNIRVELQSVERKVLLDRLSRQDYSLAIGSWFADFNDPSNFLEVFRYGKGSGNTGWEDPVFSQLLTAAQATAHDGERRQLFSRAEELLMNELPIVPLFHSEMTYLTAPSLQGATLSNLGHLDLKYAHFEVR